MAIARGSINSANRSGDSGHPCLVPRCSWNGGDIMSCVITDAIGVL